MTQYDFCDLFVDSTSKRRSRFQIMSEILQLCIKPQKKTFIMYKTSLNHEMLTSILEEMKETKILERNEASPGTYLSTSKGKEFLKKYRELLEILNDQS